MSKKYDYAEYIYKPSEYPAGVFEEFRKFLELHGHKEVPGVLSGDLPTEGRQEPPTSCLLDVTGRTDTKSLFGV